MQESEEIEKQREDMVEIAQKAQSPDRVIKGGQTTWSTLYSPIK